MENQTFKTTDLGEASTLLALGFRLQELEKSERPGQMIFVFGSGQLPPEWWVNQGNQLSPVEIAERYRNGTILVNAYDYFLATKELKSRIFSAKRD